MSSLLFEEEIYLIVGHCFKVWDTLRYGFSEVIYKDALEVEFIEEKLPFVREVNLSVMYKGAVLKHSFQPDFILFSNIILEIKSCEKGIPDYSSQQTLNYLKVSSIRIGLIVNFGKNKVEYKRLIK